MPSSPTLFLSPDRNRALNPAPLLRHAAKTGRVRLRLRLRSGARVTTVAGTCAIFDTSFVFCHKYARSLNLLVQQQVRGNQFPVGTGRGECRCEPSARPLSRPSTSANLAGS